MNKYLLVCFSIAVLITACDYKDLNVNPNSPSTATLPALLSSIEVTSSYNIGGDAAQMTSMFTQHVSGLSTQPQAWDKYNVDAEAGGYFNNVFSNALKDLDQLIKVATAQKLTVYEGISKTLMANILGVATDMYGDLPVSEGLKGETIPYPNYDKQEVVYQTIQKLLDEAIVALKSPNTMGLLPGSDDVIYKGNVKKWLAAAYSLKARYSLNLIKVDANKAATAALTAIYEGSAYRGILNASEDMDLVFGTVVNQGHPWYHWVLGRNDFRLGKAFVDLMNRTPIDPRRKFFAKPTTTGAYVGSAAGAGDGNTSQLGDYYNKVNAPVTLISFAETKLIEAEARIRLNISDPLAQTALSDAIKASIQKISGGTATTTEINDYILAYGTLSGSLSQQLKTIMDQKYIACFTQPITWTDWRRTGYPTLAPAQGGLNSLNPAGEIPRRLPVPLSERLNNPNAPKDAPSLQVPRLFWDK
jgi:hypothetical protein